MAQRAKITAANYVPSLIRTYTPALVGLVLSWLTVHFAFSVDPAVATALTAILTAVFTSLYYTLVHALEIKYPALSVLLGHKAQPVAYAKPGQPPAPPKLPAP